MGLDAKTCSRCNVLKPFTEYSKDYTFCKKCNWRRNFWPKMFNGAEKIYSRFWRPRKYSFSGDQFCNYCYMDGRRLSEKASFCGMEESRLQMEKYRVSQENVTILLAYATAVWQIIHCIKKAIEFCEITIYYFNCVIVLI